MHAYHLHMPPLSSLVTGYFSVKFCATKYIASSGLMLLRMTNMNFFSGSWFGLKWGKNSSWSLFFFDKKLNALHGKFKIVSGSKKSTCIYKSKLGDEGDYLGYDGRKTPTEWKLVTVQLTVNTEPSDQIGFWSKLESHYIWI